MTQSQAANISFALSGSNSNPSSNSNNPQSQIVKDNTNIVLGGAIGGAGGALLLAAVGIFGAYRYRRNKALAEQRSDYSFANVLYSKLQIAGTGNFQSDKGIKFINAVGSPK